jgi:hypothetical protein
MSFKLLTYYTEGPPRAGILIGERVFDAAPILAGSGVAVTDTVIGILQDWDLANAALSAAAASPPHPSAGRPLAAVKLGPPILLRGPIFARPPTIISIRKKWTRGAT